MPQNWRRWSREYSTENGKSPRILPLTPENQERVARFKIQQYYQRYKDWRDVASVWYCGRPFSQVLVEGWADVPQAGGKYPSVRNYVADVMRRFRKK